MRRVDENAGGSRRIEVPAPTSAPLISAAGVTLTLAGLVTNPAVSITGGVLLLLGLTNWFREVLPNEHVVEVEAGPAPEPVRPAPERVRRLAVGEAGHRARLPVEIYPYRAGVIGGIAGGVVMAGLAVLYGAIVHGSPWWPINLLAASASARISALDDARLRAFDLQGLVLGSLIHATLSILMGVLYAVLLPMFANRPLIAGGIVAPLLWTGIAHAVLDVVDPVLAERVDWPWFVVCQVAFGLVAGAVVARRERVGTLQHAAFAERVGLETPGVGPDRGES